MRWKVSEFKDELERDPLRRVLFVEGVRDLNFWRRAAPPQNRVNGVVYPISQIEVEVAEGGERGRIVELAKTLMATSIEGRVRFFADANGDRLHGKSLPASVFLTDARDLETYAACPELVSSLARNGFNKHFDGQALLDEMASIVRPIAAMRSVSVIETLNLPINATVDRGVVQFVNRKTSPPTLDAPSLARAIFQNCAKSLSDLDEFLGKVEKELERLQSLPHDQVFQGKDFVKALALRFEVDVAQMERLVFMTLVAEAGVCIARPNLSEAIDWLRS